VVKIGTDVYMEWKDKTEADKKKQYTGWDINKGEVGYLRASIGMVEENQVLRLIFPEKYWLHQSKDEYDFIGNLQLNLSILKSYINGEKLDTQGREDSQMKLGKALKQALTNIGFEINEDKQSYENDRKIWANSVINFMKLGIELQDKKKKPYPYISW
jgi:hypothetical protein